MNTAAVTNADPAAVPAAPTPSRARSRWFRFSLRTLVVTIALLGVWFGVICNRANRQRRAVKAIEKAGGTVGYDYEIDENGWLFPGYRSPPGPTWLRNLIGIDYFATIGAVCLNTGSDVTKATIDDAVGRLSDLPDLQSAALSGATDSMLRHLSGATQLRRLWINGAFVSGTGWEPIEHFSQLEELKLAEPMDDDSVLLHIKSFAVLKVLELDGLRVTDAGMKSLEVLFRLEDLTILDGDLPQDSGRITDAGWEPLERLTNLKRLYLKGHDVTNGALNHIKGLKSRTSLRLDDSSITDGGLWNLKGLDRLDNLYMKSAGLSDSGLECLTLLPRLDWLGIAGSHLTRAGVNELQKAMPKLQISSLEILEGSNWPP